MRALLFFGGLGALACGSSSDGGSHHGTKTDPTSFASCRGRAAPEAAEVDWEHTASLLLAAAGDPNHSAQDVIATPDETPTLGGKFTYGALSTDLQDELVRVWFDDCNGWRELGDFATDIDGRIAAPLELPSRAGVYEAHFQVLGDSSTTTAFVWVLPAETHLVVTDIDGTLTASDFELFEQILDGTHTPVPYPGAVDLTRAHASGGFIVVYLTGRPYWLTQKTRDWTSGLDCAPGPLHVADSSDDALPGEDGVGAYKLDWLEALVAKGYSVNFAYGNASTDLFAYLGAGFDPDTVWIIGAHAGENGTHGATDTWEPRVDEVRTLAPVSQPFDEPSEQ